MTDMEKRERVIKALELCTSKIETRTQIPCETCPYHNRKYHGVLGDGCCNVRSLQCDILALLKAQEEATIEPKRIDLGEETKAWLDEMDAVDALGNIANICIDWDGYRTANGLGGLVNEIWAYARYCADRLAKAQEPRVMTWQEVIGAAIECKPLYIEVKDSEDKEPGDDRWAMITQYKDSITNGMIRAMSSYITSEVLFKDWYGKTWRCWTSRPDQATREAIPWE